MSCGPDPFPNPLARAQGTPHPVSSTDNTWARYDGTTGSLQDGTWAEDDSGDVVAGGALDMNDGAITGCGGLTMTTATGPSLQDEASSDTNPTVCPDRSNTAYGLGGSVSSAHLSLIVAGGEIQRIRATDTLFKQNITMSDATNIAIQTTTGTQIGTAAGQKLAFYGTTPLAQQTGVAVTAAGIHAACVALGLFTA